jgi:hypothetical protein
VVDAERRIIVDNLVVEGTVCGNIDVMFDVMGIIVAVIVSVSG